MSNWLEIQHCKKCVHGLGYVQYTCHTETHCWRPISTVVFLVDFVYNNWRLHCAPSTCIRVSCWSPGCGVAPCQWTGTLHQPGPATGPAVRPRLGFRCSVFTYSDSDSWTSAHPSGTATTAAAAEARQAFKSNSNNGAAQPAQTRCLMWLGHCG